MPELKLKDTDKLIFKAIVGSQSYGTSTPTSDIDYKGVYQQDNNDILGFKYKEQITVTDDEVYYEVKRFLELLQTANPTVLELLYSPDDCIIETSPAFELIKQHRDKFLTKKCLNSFGGYAVAQIKKANGLDKKMNWEKEKVTRKDLLDFVYVLENGQSIPFKIWNDRNTNKYDTKFFGLVNIPNAKDVYGLYYDFDAHECFSEMVPEDERMMAKESKKSLGLSMGFGYKGLVKEGGVDENGNENYGISNQLRLSSIPKGETSIATIVYNKDGYTSHCKDYKEYQEWLKNRNVQRYVDIKGHGQKIDGKNMLHCRRLLDMAYEIATEGTIKVRRPNAEELLKIRKGEYDLKTILDKANEDVVKLNEVYKNSNLPDEVDREFVNDLLIQIRNL